MTMKRTKEQILQLIVDSANRASVAADIQTWMDAKADLDKALSEYYAESESKIETK
jgi:hypothetical protein